MTNAAVDYAERLLSEIREEVVRADAKASFVLGAATVSLGIVAAGATSSEGWKPVRLTDGYETVFWVGVGAAVMGVILLGLVVYPNVSHHWVVRRLRRVADPVANPDRADYYGHLAKTKSLTRAREQVIATSTDRLDRTVSQAWVLSHLVATKYLLTRWAFRTFLVAGLLVGTAVVDGQ